MEEEEDLKLILYLKKKKSNFSFTLGSRNHEFLEHCAVLKIKKKSILLQVNDVDVRRKSLKEIQKLLDSVKEGEAVRLLILEPSRTKLSLDVDIPPPTTIHGLCQECPPELQLKEYPSAQDWFLHAT